jgi:hypothetical protein
MASDVKNTSSNWPLSNEELREWFSTKNIPIAELARMWIQMDQNETTRAEIEKLSKDPNGIHELESRLRNRIQFGTAGLTCLVRVTEENRPARTNGSWLLSNE